LDVKETFKIERKRKFEGDNEFANLVSSQNRKLDELEKGILIEREMLRREDECNAEADKQLADFVSS
jgi:hypothetical protein